MKAAETRRKDKVRWNSLPPTSSTMYRSVSAPSGDVEVTERVVVKAYGNVAPPHNLYPSASGMMTMLPVQQSSSSSSSSSSSQVVPINNSNSSPGGGLPDSSSGRDGGSARKRPGRKTRRPDGYGSSPDAYGNGFPTSLQFGWFLLSLFMFCVLPFLQPKRMMMMMVLTCCKGLMSDWVSLFSTGAIHEGNDVTCLFVSGDGASVCC